ncbi:MAG: 2,3,4,5-tetrahydropyridine-2,6-dicarboxylate N-succinyltransferase [Oligoflexia bacterium]|nr:2,3,4,5-tetrahydropyridine-2,6-dicarboxylate N-succinyltransferase [Oligoflexia bacterium]
MSEMQNKSPAEILELLDRGQVRVWDPATNSVNAWAKAAIIEMLKSTPAQPLDAGVFEYFDKLPVKKRASLKGVRVVPGAVVRYGSFIEEGAIIMPGFVNVGAYVGSGSMVDTWATVGSCAQIGRNVHLSGGVGIGGVLEPAQAAPVIIEDGAFIGSRCIVVEGVRVGKEAVLGAGVVLTASTKIIDVRGAAPVEMKGIVPDRSVVIPGSVAKKFPAGEFGVPCALIIGTRSASTDLKTSLNSALRDHQVAV